MRQLPLLFLFFLFSASAFSQESAHGILAGNVVDEKGKPVTEATVQLLSQSDSSRSQTFITDKTGAFEFNKIAYGYYRLHISYVGMQLLAIDSIWFREERADFNMSDLVLKSGASQDLGEVIVYAEKPLIQSKDGNITVNVGESALAAGSNASELLNTVPLVTKDADGKMSVRGKEPKILIDDKPVELNLQQLQDLLESLPGSSIEKIEVMTNPPPQYANEQGGVINIVTKKGKVGKNGRISLSAGTRGEVSVNGNYTYRKQGLAISLNAGGSYGRIGGEGYSIRNNIYADSSNFFNTSSSNRNRSVRPSFRFNMDYDLNKFQSFNVVLQYNQADTRSYSQTEYTNINRFGNIYRLSERNIGSTSSNYNSSLNLSYLLRTKKPGEIFRLIGSINLSTNKSDRDFFQQFFNPDHTPNGIDSTQVQLNNTKNNGYTVRVSYDRPLFKQKTFLSTGAYYIRNNSDVVVDASTLRKSDTVFVKSSLLSNDFLFHQDIINFRTGIRQIIAENFSTTVGISAEQTGILFELMKEQRKARNNYWTLLPFANINKSWKDQLNITLAYRRSIRRPGINELNPTIDFSDPYNVRFGNEKLEASTADNFDLVIGRTRRLYYVNIGMGYNNVKDIFSRVRTLLPDSKTQISWENISGRKEYEVSTWAGLTVTRKIRTNVSASYTFNQYSEFDRRVNKYRNGGSFTSNLNSTYTPTDLWNITGSFTVNRFANPQGFGRWNWSMNAGVQKKFLQKRLSVTVNIIDPFIQQVKNYTYGTNFYLQSFNKTNTRNFRLSVGYNLTKVPKKKVLPLGKLPGIKK